MRRKLTCRIAGYADGEIVLEFGPEQKNGSLLKFIFAVAHQYLYLREEKRIE
jgi:hypothetical protein